MNKTYIIFLILTGIAAFISAFPALVLIGMIFTLGIGLVLAMIAPNLFVGLLCFLPVALRWVPKPLGIALFLIFLGAAAYGPGLMSQSRADADHAAASTKDTPGTGILAGRTVDGIDFIRPGHLALDPRTNLHPSDICGQLCQRVLHGGQVNWIRVMIQARNGSISQTSIVTRGEEADCAQTLCFVYAKETGQTADLTLEAKQTGLGRRAHRHQWRITQGAGGNGSLLFQQTETRRQVISTPGYLYPDIDGAWNGSTEFGFVFSRRSQLYNALNPEQIAANLGLTLAPLPSKGAKTNGYAKVKPGPSATARIATLLDTNAELSDRSEREISSWMRDLQNVETLSTAQIEVIFNVLNDTRYRYPPVDALTAHPTFMKEQILPWAFETLETRHDFKPGQMNKLISMFSSTRISTELLAPYRDRYLALLDAPNALLGDHTRAERSERLWKAVGRFGFNPEPMLRAHFSGANHSARQIMDVICHSESKWHDTLTPLVRETVKRSYDARPGTRPSAPVNYGLNFLYFSGHKEEVRTFVAATEWERRENLLKYTYPEGTPKRHTGATLCW